METNVIPVRPYPFRQSFDSFEEAIRHAINHPLRQKANDVSDQLRYTTLINAYWSLSEFVLEFSNEKWLHIFISEGEVCWNLLELKPVLPQEPQFRIGAPPVRLDWHDRGYTWLMDPSELVSKRIGSEFTELFINETLFLYFRAHLVFQFHSAYRTDTSENVLAVMEDD